MNSRQVNLTRTEYIDKLLQQRQPLAEEIAILETRLREVCSSLHQLENYRQRLQVLVNDSPLHSQLEKFNLSSVCEAISQEYNSIRLLLGRFQRETLNIGVIGETGAGKSTFLQSLSGLSDLEIPAFMGGACTAVRSTIINQEGETYGEVILHSEETFLAEVIAPYYEVLNLGDSPCNLDEFAQERFPFQPPSEVKTSKKEKMYAHLREDYYNNIAHYRHLLKSGVAQNFRIAKAEIPKFVIQKRDKNGCLTTYNHLAVREVKIFCSFQDPHSDHDVGKVALVDVPGMGDTRLGDEQLMLETLGKEVDIVLFIHRPDPLRYLWKDYSLELYDSADKALNDFSRRSFLILNYNSINNNFQACQALQENLQHLNVVSCEIIDCSQVRDVHKLFNMALMYLGEKITDLDRTYARSRQDYLINKLVDLKSQLISFRNPLQQFTNEYRTFNYLFMGKNERGGLWGDLTSHLGRFLKELATRKDEENEEFKAKVKQALEWCRHHRKLPSQKLIIQEHYAVGGFLDLYLIYLKEIRTHLSRCFVSLDMNLQESIEKVKSEVTDIVSKQGRLENLSRGKGSKFLQEILYYLPYTADSDLRLGLQNFANFNVASAGIILRQVRQHLHPLFSQESLPLDLHKSEAIHANFDSIYEQMLVQCEESLSQLYSLPNSIAYSMVEEFVDRIFFAEGVKLEWNSFLWDNRYVVFTELQELAKRDAMQKEWEMLVQKVETNIEATLDAVSEVT